MGFIEHYHGPHEHDNALNEHDHMFDENEIEHTHDPNLLVLAYPKFKEKIQKPTDFQIKLGAIINLIDIHLQDLHICLQHIMVMKDYTIAQPYRWSIYSFI